MCGCTCVGSPACCACSLQPLPHLAGREPRAAPADEQRRLAGIGQLRAHQQPGLQRRQGRRRPPARCAACRPCPARGRWRRPRRSSPRPRPTRCGPAPPARPRAGRSRTAARRWRGRAPPAPGRRLRARARPAPRPGRPTRPWAAAWAPSAGAGRPPGSAPPDHRGPTSGTGRARPPARWRCCAAPGRGRAAAPSSCARGAAARPAARLRTPRRRPAAAQRVAVHRQRARGQPALDPQVLGEALQLGVQRLPHAGRRAQAAAGRSSRDSAALATSPMRIRNSVPISAA